MRPKDAANVPLAAGHVAIAIRTAVLAIAPVRVISGDPNHRKVYCAGRITTWAERIVKSAVQREPDGNRLLDTVLKELADQPCKCDVRF